MTEYETFTQHFLRGLRSVPGYMESLCDTCKGACGERPDDQCLLSAWSGFIQIAYESREDAEEVGRRCALTQMQHSQSVVEIQFPCEKQAYAGGS